MSRLKQLLESRFGNKATRVRLEIESHYIEKIYKLSTGECLLDEEIQREIDDYVNLCVKNVELRCLSKVFERCLRLNGIHGNRRLRDSRQYHFASMHGCHCYHPGGNVFICLMCGYRGCERDHAWDHYVATGHEMALNKTKGLLVNYNEGCYETPENIRRRGANKMLLDKCHILSRKLTRDLRDFRNMWSKDFEELFKAKAKEDENFGVSFTKMYILREERKDEGKHHAYLLSRNESLYSRLKNISTDKALMMRDIFEDVFSSSPKKLVEYGLENFSKSFEQIKQDTAFNSGDSIRPLFEEAMKLRKNALEAQETHFAKFINGHHDYYNYHVAKLSKLKSMFRQIYNDYTQVFLAVETMKWRGEVFSLEENTVNAIAQKLQSRLKLTNDNEIHLPVPYLTRCSKDPQDDGLACLMCGFGRSKDNHYAKTGHWLFFDNSSGHLWSIEEIQPLEPTGFYPDIPEATLKKLWSDMLGRIVDEMVERRQVLETRVLSFQKDVRERVAYIKELYRNLAHHSGWALEKCKQLTYCYDAIKKHLQAIDCDFDTMDKDAKAADSSSCLEEVKTTEYSSSDLHDGVPSCTIALECLPVSQNAETSATIQENQPGNDECEESESEVSSEESITADDTSQSVSDDSSSFEDSVKSTTETVLEDTESEERISSTSSSTDSSWDHAGSTPQTATSSETEDKEAVESEVSTGSGWDILQKLRSFFF